MSPARVILFGNEKGGAGKSTVAVHVAVALLHEGARVVIVDLDERQQSTGHFFANRASWNAAQGAGLPQPCEIAAARDAESLREALATAADFVIVDTPGADTDLSRAAHGFADLIVTPMNDSFVDFDMLGVVDPVTLEVLRPSLYAETIWEARKSRAIRGDGAIDWVVLRNRLASVEARNRRRVDERLATLSRRVGFRALAGLRDRVIYRELFPFGLTVSDLSRTVRPVQVSLAHVAARQELRILLHELGLADVAEPAVAAE
ncbi:MAG: division plane positioning ATPase MipZ [Pseudomonadota bacterium]|nr:division plane positioning ATPase MipZ [Pseudomonadota bacterium]